MNDCLVQEGIITGTTNHSVTVSVTPHTACGGCQASSLCFGSSGKAREIVISQAGGNFEPGQPVRVIMARTMVQKAVSLGYLYPLLLLVATLFLTHALTQSEALSALLSLFVLVPYYLILYLNRHRLAKEFRFSVEALPK